jgi:ubiquinol-cytochrome c reductase iron-sulfur subunit
VGAIGAAFWAVPFVSSWQPSARAKALGAPVEADISKLKDGEMLIQAWRGKPVWILKRTRQMLDDLKKVNPDDLSDPKSEQQQQPDYAKNDTRSIKPEILVMVGTCTHLGCSPKFRPDHPTTDLPVNWEGGFFCPCHGSRYDLSGRVYKGVPAPLNMVVPKYRFADDNTIVIGEDPLNAKA